MVSHILSGEFPGFPKEPPGSLARWPRLPAFTDMLTRGVGAASGEPSLLVIAPTRELAIQIQEESDKWLARKVGESWFIWMWVKMEDRTTDVSRVLVLTIQLLGYLILTHAHIYSLSHLIWDMDGYG